MLSNVDLPLPEGPTIDINCPLFILKLISSRTTDSPAGDSNILVIFFNSITTVLPFFSSFFLLFKFNSFFHRMRMIGYLKSWSFISF
jgi:hypothetical protein